MSEYPIAGLKTLAELADRSGVSGPSVIRCVKKLGFDGYPEFQRALHDEVQSAYDRSAAVAEGDTASSNAGVIERRHSESVRRTMQLTLESDLDNLAATIARSRKNVLCLGGRVSHALAMIVHAHLQRSRPNVDLVSTNPVQRSERLMDVTRGDIVLLFDFAPYDAIAASFVTLAADARATIACFTDSEQSPAAARAHYVFCADSRAASGSPSMVAALGVAELLIDKVRSEDRARPQPRSLADSRQLDAVPLTDASKA